MYQLLQDFFPIILLPTNSPNCCTHQGEHGKQIHLQQLQLNRSERAAERLHQTHPPAIKHGFSSRVFTTAVSSREARPATRLLLVSMGDFMGFPRGPLVKRACKFRAKWSANGLDGGGFIAPGWSAILLDDLRVMFQANFSDSWMVGRPWNSHGFKPQPHIKIRL